MADAKSYTPVTLSNGGTYDYFSVNVKNGVYSGGYNGSGTLITQEAVNKTWTVDESGAGGSNLSITAQWNASDELPMFNRNSVYFSHYTNNAWDNGSVGIAGGTGPYTITRTGISSFSPFAVTSSPTVLPLYLFNFGATNNNNIVLLKWQTQNEINTAQFNVQRSTDGLHFNTIGNLKAMGNSVATNNYSYVDNDAAKLNNTKVYYRVQTVDKDNKITMSKIISLDMSITGTGIFAWPNPVKDNLNVKLSGYNGEAIISIYDMSGKDLLMQKQNATSAISINTSSFKAGTYLIKVNENGNVLKQSFIKQ
jgi:hypothetical protein